MPDGARATFRRILSWLSVVTGMVMCLAACSTMPTMTRTGSVEDIVIGPSSLHLNVTVHKGDEVRWINERDGIIQIIFLDSLEGRVNCQRGFGLLDIAETTTLKPQESVSVCFAEPGSWPYTVRLDQPAPTGWFNAPGRVLVENYADGG
jgi:plastocyanin